MAKWKVRSSHSLGGGRIAEVGDVIELDEKVGRERQNYGWLEPVPDPVDLSDAPAPAPAPPGPPRKYVVLTSHALGGGKFVEPGEVIELDPQTGAHRQSLGFVEPYVENDEDHAAVFEAAISTTVVAVAPESTETSVAVAPESTETPAAVAPESTDPPKKKK